MKPAISGLLVVAVAIGAILTFNAQKAAHAPAPAEHAEAAAELTTMQKAYGVWDKVGLAGPRPDWAYAMVPSAPIPAPIPGDEDIAIIPGSPVQLTVARTKDRFFPADWWPQDHPPQPRIISHGRKEDLVFACTYCHLANGFGRPENASVAGKPVEYIVAQMKAFKEGTRPGSRMPAIARQVTDEEVMEAAKYFASVQPKPWVTVVETDQVPDTKPVGGLQVVNLPQVMEPIGSRIVEVANDIRRVELRDARADFTAYVPKGSVARGAAIVASAGDPTKACAACHGPDLHGVGIIPSIAGKSPTYTFRELHDFQSGARHDPDAVLMAPIVAEMRLDDMIAVAAYVATLKP